MSEDKCLKPVPREVAVQLVRWLCEELGIGDGRVGVEDCRALWYVSDREDGRVGRVWRPLRRAGGDVCGVRMGMAGG